MILLFTSRPPARTRGLKPNTDFTDMHIIVASSREDAWIETANTIGSVAGVASRPPARTRGLKQTRAKIQMHRNVASSREDAWIETCQKVNLNVQ